MKRIASILITLLSTTPAYAQMHGDFNFPADSRIRVLPYDESDVYTITTKYGYQTNIVFGPDEEIETISMGDRSLWQIIPSGNRLFIRPMLEDVITNMTVLTNKRSYQFDVKSVGEDSKNTAIVYVAKFVYPDPAQEAMVSAYDAQIETVESIFPEAVNVQDNVMPSTPVPIEPPTQFSSPSVNDAPQVFVPPTSPVMATSPSMPVAAKNTAYTFAGPDELAPLQVHDDGRSTYFKYRDMGQPLPNAYKISADGNQKPVAHYVKDGFMIIDDVSGEWVLKNSAGTIMVYNEALNPAKE